jgi:hypothetical protein
MEYVLPVLVSILMLAVLFRRQIKRASSQWFNDELPVARETLADVLEREREKLRDKAKNAGCDAPDTSDPA